MSHTKPTLVVIGLSSILLGGCGHGASYGPEKVCTSHGRSGCSQYDFKYSEDAASLGEKTRESLDRHLAASQGTTYYPSKYAAETPKQFAERSREEGDRQSAFSRGEAYTPPMRSGESTEHWFKRSDDSSKLWGDYKRSSSSSSSSSSRWGR
jgi:hypothetical protein